MKSIALALIGAALINTANAAQVLTVELDKDFQGTFKIGNK